MQRIDGTTPRGGRKWWKGKSLMGHVLLAKRYDHEQIWTYYVRAVGPNPAYWDLRMVDDGRTLLGSLVEFGDVRVNRGERSGFAASARIVGRSYVAADVDRIVRNVNGTSSPQPLPASPRCAWIVGGRGEAWGDIAALLSGVVTRERVDVRISSTTDVARVLRETARREDLDPARDVVVLARGGGTDVIALDSTEVAYALGEVSRRVATMLAVGHARDGLRIGAMLHSDLVCTTPTDAARLLASAARLPQVLPTAIDSSSPPRDTPLEHLENPDSVMHATVWNLVQKPEKAATQARNRSLSWMFHPKVFILAIVVTCALLLLVAFRGRSYPSAPQRVILPPVLPRGEAPQPTDLKTREVVPSAPKRDRSSLKRRPPKLSTPSPVEPVSSPPPVQATQPIERVVLPAPPEPYDPPPSPLLRY